MPTTLTVVDDLVEVTVTVPRGRVPGFYEWFGRWLAEAPQVEAAAHPQRWDPVRDEELARRVWPELSATARTLLSALIDNPDRRYWAEDLARTIGIPNGMHGIAGVLSWPARKMRTLGRTLPIESAPDDRGGSSYWMTPASARLFAGARSAAWDDLGS